jgi:DNA repair protein RecN (Recombination protein N)
VALKRIFVRDFVLVEQLEQDLENGFTVLTGETGAGKSILVDALQFALGNRADTTSIRTGAARAEVAVEFDCPDNLHVWLNENGFDLTDTLLLRRSVDAQGKSRAWINGSAAPASQLREVAEHLVDIHGQHAWQSLTRPASVRALLDAYAGVDLMPLNAVWRTWRETQSALNAARGARDTLELERERLTWQIGEVDKLSPGENEWDELNATHTRLSNAQSLIDAAQTSLGHLENDAGGATTELAHAARALHGHVHLDPEFQSILEILESTLAQTEDAVHSLHFYLRKTEPDPSALAALDARMALWMGLARRYKRTPKELPLLWATWKADLGRLNAASDIDALEVAESRAAHAFQQEALAVSRGRQRAAPKLAKAITQAMQGLGMQGGRFEVLLEKTASPSASGLEDAVFLVAGHAGTPLRPVGKVASGGELSRIALAIAVTTSRLGTAQTLIFDEVDSGVGGAVAEAVGRLMKQLGHDRQVLAVTHLPQVAACADHHLLVIKHSTRSATSSRVIAVAGEERVAEVARMLGGERLSGTTLAHAKELLGPAR